MKPLNRFALIAALVLSVGQVWASDARPADTASGPSVVDRVETSVVRAVDATRRGVSVGARAAVDGVETGVRAVGRTFTRGAHAVGEFAERAGQKIRDLAS